MNRKVLYENIVKNISNKKLNEEETSTSNYIICPKEGDIVEDYNGLRWEVIKAGKINIWNEISKYDNGIMEDELDYLNNDDIIVACKGIDEGDNLGETAVFTYGQDGVKTVYTIMEQDTLNNEIYNLLTNYCKNKEEDGFTVPAESMQNALNDFIWNFYKGKVNHI